MKILFKLRLMLISIIVLSAFSQPLFSEYWEDKINDPCPPFQDTVSWIGPLDTTICAWDCEKISGCDSCCFTVVYYEATQYNDGTYDDFGVNIVGIFWTQGSGCDTCGNGAVMEAFMNALIERKCNEDPTFLGRDSLTMPDTIPVYEYAKGGCFEGTYQCWPEENRCCSRIYDCYFNELGTFIGMSRPTDSEIMPPCTTHTGCDPICNLIPFESMDDIMCNMPCTNGLWQNHKPDTVRVDSCAGCHLVIHYRTRECVPEGFVDLRIDKIDTLGCNNCNQDLFSIALDSVMKHGADELIGPKLDTLGRCDTSLRISYAACWGWGLWPYKENEWHPCDYSACCWKRYIVCRITWDSLYYELYDWGTSGVDTCNLVFPIPCEFKCEVTTPRAAAFESKIKIKKEVAVMDRTFVVPNPSTGNIDIHFVSNKYGEYIIEIIDMSGNEIIRTRFNKKTSEAILPFNMTKFSTGFYLYRIKSENGIVSKGSFSIIK